MKHDKTFEAIGKLKDVEAELHRLKNALEMANKALDAKRPWVGLTDEEVEEYYCWEDFQVGCGRQTLFDMVRDIEAKLKEKNT